MQSLFPRDYSERKYTRTHARTEAPAHKHFDYTKLNIHSLKWAANAQETWNGTENIAGLQFWEEKCLTTACLNTDGKEPDGTLSITI